MKSWQKMSRVINVFMVWCLIFNGNAPIVKAASSSIITSAEDVEFNKDVDLSRCLTLVEQKLAVLRLQSRKGNLFNELPTDISLDSSIVSENQGVGEVVGTLSVTDPDVGRYAYF